MDARRRRGRAAPPTTCAVAIATPRRLALERGGTGLCVWNVGGKNKEIKTITRDFNKRTVWGRRVSAALEDCALQDRQSPLWSSRVQRTLIESKISFSLVQNYTNIRRLWVKACTTPLNHKHLHIYEPIYYHLNLSK